jgi:hypothetical protein
VVVIVMSLSFILFVTVLHIVGKVGCGLRVAPCQRSQVAGEWEQASARRTARRTAQPDPT